MTAHLDARTVLRTLKKLACEVTGPLEAVDDAHRLVLAHTLSQVIEGKLGQHCLPAKRPFPLELYSLVGQAYARIWRETVRNRAEAIQIPGLVYTPFWIASRLVERCEDSARPSGRILDPACGAGSLLLAWLARHPDSALTGWDIDQAALDLCRAVLSAYARDHGIELRLDLSRRDLFEKVEPVACHDVVLLNPPYGTSLSPAAIRFARRSRVTGREPDFFVLSLEKAMELAEGGTLGAIVPDVIRLQPEYARLRRSMIESGRVRSIEQLPFGSFPGVTVQTVLLVLGPGEGTSRKVRLGIYPGTSWRVDFGDIQALGDHPFRLLEPDLACLWDLCSGSSVTLGEIARCHEGVHTGNVRHKLFTDDPRKPGARKMLKGSDIQPFSFTFNGRYLCFDPSLIDRKAGEYASFRDPNLFTGPKLLSRQTSDRLVVCLDREEHVSDNTLHCIQLEPSAGFPLEWLELLLNSALATSLYRIQSGERRRPLPQIKLKLLRRLPIREPKASSEVIRELAARAEQEARRAGLSRNSIARIDRLVFDAYGIEENVRERLGALSD